MSPAQTRQLQAYQSKMRQLAHELSQATGLILSGSLIQRSTRCGNPRCRCHADPPQLHGPYWQWSYRPTGGKTVSRLLGERQALLYQGWIANRRHLLALVHEMEEVSHQAAEILLAEPPPESVTPAASAAASGPRPRRVTQHLSEAVIQASELIEPVAEAAQHWLESKDDDDREVVSEARDSLLTVLDESPALAPTLAQLVRLLSTVALPA